MNQQTTLKQWLLSAPVFFAITSFLLAVLISLTAGLLLPNNETTFSIIGTLMFITTVASAIITIRKIPTRKMDRAGIVTIFNIKMLVLALASISSLFVTLYITPIQMWLFKTMQSPAGIVLGFLFAICITLISLYVLGITITGLWACFLRARTMNIPLWKIICSIPFGFNMIWLPGYFISNDSDKKPIVTTNINWISRLTNWTFKSPTNAGFLFTVLIICTGLFNGTTTTLLTVSMALMFAIWLIQTGENKFKKDIGNAYATTAVIINLAIVIYLITTVLLF